MSAPITVACADWRSSWSTGQAAAVKGSDGGQCNKHDAVNDFESLVVHETNGWQYGSIFSAPNTRILEFHTIRMLP